MTSQSHSSISICGTNILSINNFLVFLDRNSVFSGIDQTRRRTNFFTWLYKAVVDPRDSEHPFPYPDHKTEKTVSPNSVSEELLSHSIVRTIINKT
jgi:hypothetical protein